MPLNKGLDTGLIWGDASRAMRTPISAMVVSIALAAGCGDDTNSGVPAAGSGGAATGGAQATGGAANTGGMATTGGAPSTGGAQSTGGAATFGGSSSTNGGTNTGGTTGGSKSSAGSAGMPSGGGASGDANTGGKSGGGASAGGVPSGGSGGSVAMQRCSRESLQAATDALAKALEAADSTQMTLASGATYAENMKSSTFTDGIWKSAIEIAFRRDLLDAESCETFSEIIVTAGHKYVIGARLKVADGKVAEVDALVTDEGDWLFDADGYFKYSKAEDWSVIPEAERDTRETLIAAANAYFDLFNDKTTEVPWNTPCTRLEGGQLNTGTKCDTGVPSGITFANKHFVVDRDLGTAVGMVRFGGANGLPDSHMFRCLKGKIRYVHTITVCNEPNCGM
jgi:hypothetical protein